MGRPGVSVDDRRDTAGSRELTAGCGSHLWARRAREAARCE